VLHKNLSIELLHLNLNLLLNNNMSLVQVIDPSECVGNSLSKINNNFKSLQTAVINGNGTTSVIATGSTTSRTLQDRFADVVNVKDFGAVGDGVTDDTNAIQAAIDHICNIGIGMQLFVPKGIYICNNNIILTTNSSIKIQGNGTDISIISFIGVFGFIINLETHNASISIDSLTLTTDQQNLGTAITVTLLTGNPNPANTALSVLSNLIIRGNDGYYRLKGWKNGIIILEASNFNFINVFVSGSNSGIEGVGWIPLNTSTFGAVLSGTSTNIPVVFNFIGCEFNYVGVGIDYDYSTQGVTINQCNFVGGNVGININNLLTYQLAVTDSQFNVNTVAINLQYAIAGVMISDNLFLIPDNSTGINVGRAKEYIISNNSISFIGSVNMFGMSLISCDYSPSGLISNNSFVNPGSISPIGCGINILSTFDAVLITNNIYNGVQYNIINNSINSGIHIIEPYINPPKTGQINSTNYGGVKTISGSTVLYPDNYGKFTIELNETVNNIITVIMQNGDSNVLNNITVTNIYNSNTNTSIRGIAVYNINGNPVLSSILLRINWIVIGY